MNIKEELLNYFNYTKTNRLIVLDNKYRHFYTGVTLQYLTYELFKAKYSKSNVAQALKELLLDKQIKCLNCPNIKKIVFEPIKSNNQLYYNTSQQLILEYLDSNIKQ